ncbi:hypothetical protein CFC21_010180 [Triticum aestivum]|uniref:Uncharacterized protein n=2 Tax=Triticum aestivum TaxID=4565 RepID=A0A3B5ZNK4_WHEAT|nr:hypothetical protein CFC21_010180 [Triticum aestivum]
MPRHRSLCATTQVRRGSVPRASTVVAPSRRDLCATTQVLCDLLVSATTVLFAHDITPHSRGLAARRRRHGRPSNLVALIPIAVAVAFLLHSFSEPPSRSLSH